MTYLFSHSVTTPRSERASDRRLARLVSCRARSLSAADRSGEQPSASWRSSPPRCKLTSKRSSRGADRERGIRYPRIEPL